MTPVARRVAAALALASALAGCAGDAATEGPLTASTPGSTPTPAAAAALATSTAPPLVAVPDTRLARLARGVNVRHWFADDRPRPDAFGDDDARRVADLGIGHVRVPFRLSTMLDPAQPDRPVPAVAGAYRRAVAGLVARGFAVVVVPFATEAERVAIVDDAVTGTRFARFWTALAGIVGTIDPDRVFLEVLSEPIAAPGPWSTRQAELVAAIRAGSPTATIVVDAPLATPGSDAVDALTGLTPVGDPNVVYSFHFYEPYELAYAGLESARGGAEGLGEVPYPTDDRRCLALTRRTPAGPPAELAAAYCAQRWDTDRLARRVAVAADWGRARGVPLYVGEFGVSSAGVAGADRVRWLADARAAFEAAGMGWSLWAYDDPQGLVERGRAPVDRQVLGALGLPAAPL